MTLLSIIIPAHNEERRLRETLPRVLQFLRTQKYASEVLVVENGSIDRTAPVVAELARSEPQLQLLREAQRGKGLAVRRGMLAARGAFRFMCDADLSMPIEQVSRFLPQQLAEFDVAIGSREIPGAVRFDEPAFTHLRGRVFSNLVKLAVLPGIEDTQCGFKCFTAAAAEDLFRVQRLDGLSFDVELLFIARLRGYRICEVPIDWIFHRETKVRMVRDTLQMLRDVLTLRRNLRAGYYERAA
jgi:glycosyltransferase involved in cell wall biosynthesis